MKKKILLVICVIAIAAACLCSCKEDVKKDAPDTSTESIEGTDTSSVESNTEPVESNTESIESDTPISLDSDEIATEAPETDETNN